MLGSGNLTPVNIGAALSSHTHTEADITDLGSYLPLSGGTLTGDLAMDDSTIEIEDSNIDIGTAPSSAVYDRVLRMVDGNGDMVGYLQATQTSSGSHYNCFGAPNSDDSYQNQIMFGWDINDNPKTFVSYPDTFRDAISAAAASHTHDYLPLSGGTATGSISVQSSNIDRDGADPSSSVTGNSYIFTDKDGEGIGIIRPGRQTDGREDLILFARNENSNGDQIQNGLRISIAKDGTRSYGVDDPLAFCNAISALPLSGGTMTGAINMDGNNIENAERVYAHYHQMTESGNTRGNIYVSGDYLYIQGYNSSGTSTCQYRFNLTDWGIAFRPYSSGAWQSWESHIYNALASRTANTVLAAPNGSAGAATFRALVPADCSWLGNTESKTISSPESIPNSAWTLLGEVTLAAGKWILTGNCQFLSNSTGRRYICVKESAASPTTNDQRYYTANTTALNGAATTLTKTVTRSATANQKFGIWVWQNSGAALNCYGYLQATRIS